MNSISTISKICKTSVDLAIFLLYLAVADKVQDQSRGNQLISKITNIRPNAFHYWL